MGARAMRAHCGAPISSIIPLTKGNPLMKTSTLSRKALQACNFAASKEETRYYLNGVYVKIDAGGAEYCATDGHMLLAYREELEKDSPANTLTGEFIIPSSTCADKHIKGSKWASDAVELAEMTDGFLRIDNALVFRPIDGTFPDWRRVLPSEIDGVSAQFDPALLVRLQKAGAIFDCRFPVIAHNGINPALVRFGEHTGLFGVVMPFPATVLTE